MVSFTFNGAVSVQGRTDDGTWLPKLRASAPAKEYVEVHQEQGFTALWGKAGGWMTNLLGAGAGPDDRDDIWALNGANVSLSMRAKVVGYRLRTFSYIGDASFAFEELN